MRTKFQKQTERNASRAINLQPQAEEVGQLTPVHIEDIVKDRNLDYLQSLGELVERSKANPMWYQYESNQNKLKFLQVYQLSINYARNTQSIYGSILNQLDEEFAKRKQKVENLKNQILTHKQKTTRLKKQYRKDRLIKEKEKALNYQRSLKQLRDNMIKQKSRLKENNQKLRWENQERKQKAAERQRELEKQRKLSAQKLGINMHLHPSAPPYPMYPPYPYYPPTPVHEAQPYFYPYQAPPSPGLPPGGQTPLQLAQRNQKLLQHIYKEASLKMDAHKQEQKRRPSNDLNQQSRSNNDFVLQTDSIIQRPASFKEDNIKKKSQQKNGSEMSKVPELKQSAGKQQGDKLKQANSLNKNSDKSWTLRNSDNIRESVADSEKNDLVDNLSKNPPASKIIRDKSQMSKMSRKQSDMISAAQMDSLIDVQLRPQSQNKLSDQFERRNNKIQHKVSILDKQPDIPTQKITNKQENHDEDDDRYSLKKQDNKNLLKIKFDQSGLLESSVESHKHFGYLQQSNQGKNFKGKQSNNSSDKDYLNVKGLKVKPADRIGVSVVDSMLDNSSRNESKNDLEDYEDDFQEDVSDEALAGKTRVKVNVDSSESSPEKQKLPDFFPLYKNYFILKQEAKVEKKLSDSKYSSGLGSLKQYSVKFVGSEKKKVAYDRSQQEGSDLQGNDMIQFIDMPMDSIIAKPSKLKQSTIKKSAIQNKIHKSHDPKSKAPGEFILNTPIVSGAKGEKSEKKDDIDDNFAKIKGETLQSRILAEADDKKLKVPLPQRKPDEKLAMDMIESQIIEQENGSKEEEDANQQSIELSIIPETQNESLHTQKSSKHKILLLIDRKYRQKGAVQFDKNIIKNQIESLVKNKREEYGWQQLTNVFNELAKKKQEEVNALILERKKKIKSSKQAQSKKDSESEALSRQNSNKIVKNSQKIQKSKDPFKQKPSQLTENDDLSYSRSYLQNPISQNQKNGLKVQQQAPSSKSTQPETIKTQFHSLPNQQQSRKQVSSPTSANSSTTINNKFLRDQDNSKNSTVSSNRMLNKVIQSSKFDKDDQIENTIKANFGNTKLHSVTEQLDQSF